MYFGLDQCLITVGESYHEVVGGRKRHFVTAKLAEHCRRGYRYIFIRWRGAKSLYDNRYTINEIQNVHKSFHSPGLFPGVKIQSDMGRERKNRLRPAEKNKTQIAERTRSQINVRWAAQTASGTRNRRRYPQQSCGLPCAPRRHTWRSSPYLLTRWSRSGDECGASELSS